MKFRKRPVVVEAIQFYSSMPTYQLIVDFGGGSPSLERHGDILLIKTLEGVLVAKAGDWIIKGIKGEFYPCRADIFESSYEAVLATDAGGEA